MGGARIGHARRWSRRLAVQGIYQWQLAGGAAADIQTQLEEGQDFARADADYFRAILHGVIADAATLDAHLSAWTQRPIERIDPVERAVLRCACYELMRCGDVPYRVVIDEAVELTKLFGAEQAHTFVNAALDKLVGALQGEASAARD